MLYVIYRFTYNATVNRSLGKKKRMTVLLTFVSGLIDVEDITRAHLLCNGLYK